MTEAAGNFKMFLNSYQTTPPHNLEDSPPPLPTHPILSKKTIPVINKLFQYINSYILVTRHIYCTCTQHGDYDAWQRWQDLIIKNCNNSCAPKSHEQHSMGNPYSNLSKLITLLTKQLTGYKTKNHQKLAQRTFTSHPLVYMSSTHYLAPLCVHPFKYWDQQQSPPVSCNFLPLYEKHSQLEALKPIFFLCWFLFYSSLLYFNGKWSPFHP